MRIWVVFGGKYYTDGGLCGVYHKKKDAVSDIKEEGYSYNKKSSLYLNEKAGKWYRIEKEVSDTLIWWTV